MNEKLNEIQSLIYSLMYDVRELGATGEILSDNFQEMLNLAQQSMSMLQLQQNSENVELSDNMYSEQASPRHM